MPYLGRAKQRIGSRIGSSDTASEGKQNLLCAYPAAALLVGCSAMRSRVLGGSTQSSGLLIAALAVYDGRESWRGDACCH